MRGLKKNRTRWWPLYLIMALVFGLFLFEVRAPLSVPGHRAVEIGLILAACGSTLLWVRAHPLELTEGQRTYKTHYTWLEELQERRPLIVETPGALEAQAAFGGSTGGKPGQTVQDTFLPPDLESVHAQVLTKN